MSSTIRRTARAYLDRRTPWGPPWWVYAVTLGAANLVRQAVLWRTDAGSTVGLAAFVVMVLVVFGAVTGTATLLRAARPPPPGGGTGRRTGAADAVDRGAREPEDEADGGDGSGQSYVASADQRLPSMVSR